MSPAGPSAVLALVLLTGCAFGDPAATSDTPRRDLGARPEPVATGTEAPPASATPTAGASAEASVRPATTSPPAPTARAAASARPVPAPAGEGPYSPVGSLTDLRGDHGNEGPTYADVVGVLLEDDGTRLRATVRMGGTVPVDPAPDETFGIGVDLYDRSGELESDYQLFADGGVDGWFAYLSTPQGFVRYPGRFSLAGDQLVFTVPWSSVGGRKDGWTKAFSDWSGTGGGTLGGNATSNDRAPLASSSGYDVG